MSDPLSLGVPTAGFVGSCLVSEKRGCVRWEGEFRISQRHCPSPLALAPTILEPGPRLKKKEIKAARYQCGHPPGQRGPPWAVSWWGEPGSRVNLLALFAPRPSHGSLQIPSNAHSSCHRCVSISGRGRKEEVARIKLLCPGGATIPG